MDKPLFLTGMLGSPLCRIFTTVRFDTSEQKKLNFALFHVLPHLPRIHTFEGFSKKTTRALFGPGGMTQIARTKVSIVEDERNAHLRAWCKFKAIAVRIRNWKVSLEDAEFIELFGIHRIIADQMRSLSLSTPNFGGFPIFESESSRFPLLLRILPNLTSLSISKADSLANGDACESPLSKSVLSVPCAFTRTLTSFTFRGDPSSSPVDPSFFRFLTRFTRLRHLRIEASKFDDLDDPVAGSKFAFPNLTDLELIGSLPGSLDKVLRHLSLPKLEVLTLEYRELDPKTHFASEPAPAIGRVHFASEPVPAIGRVHTLLDDFKSTLRKVYFVGSEGLYKGASEYLMKGSFGGAEAETLSYDVDISWQLGEAEASRSEVSRSGGSPVDKDILLNGMLGGSRDLMVWAGQELDRIEKNGDITEAKRVVRALKPVWDLKKFIDD
jgi:hypothetical protein